MSKLQTIGIVSLFVIAITLLEFFSSDALLSSKQNFDRQNLYQFFNAGSYDNDLVLDTFLIPAGLEHAELINLHLLGLRRDRFAYLAKQEGEVVAVAVPATAEDGFNGTIELLVSIDMYGRIQAARVIEDLNSDELYGIVDVIESQWMKLFSGNAMRDILRISWQTIESENEYDQFVGASITPQTVSDRIYDTLVFFQSNRITLMTGDS